MLRATRLRALPLLAISALGLGSCKQFGFQDHSVPVQRDEVVATSGVRYEDLYLGKGKPAGPGETLMLDYTVWLKDGTRVDSTLDRGVPQPVKIGDAFIEGLNEGLASMRADGRRRIEVPAKLAYGAKGVEGLIPPNSDLVFEVHVIEIRTH